MHETRKVDDFTKIREDGFANVVVQVGPETSVKITGDDNIVPLVKTRVEKGELIIANKKSFRQKTKLLVSITLPTLTSVALDGAGNITVHNASGQDFSASLDGAGNVTVDGAVGNLSASLDGAGNLKLSDLKAKQASATVDGAGNIDVWATDNLTASVDGIGNIRYKGSPSVQKTVDGIGRVEQRD
jgi:hypothetical protein